MCFTKQEGKLSVRTTKKRVTVYKIYRRHYDSYNGSTWASPFQGAIVKKGSLLKEERFGYRHYEGKRDNRNVYEGIHTYKSLAIARDRVKGDRTRLIVKCHIPIGTKYFENESEMVCLALRVGKIHVPKRKPKMASR